MKKLITLLAVLGVATTATADDHMKQNGSFRVQYNNTNNYDRTDVTNDKAQNISQRLIWSPSFKVSDKITVNATFVHAANWGNNGDQTPGAGAAATSFENEGNVLLVNEAYANWMIDDQSMIRVGRGSFTMADGRVVAQNSWEQVARAFDGLMYTRDMEALRVSAFGVRGSNLSTTGASTGNNAANFFGANLDFKSLPEFLKTANLHYVIVKQDDVAATTTDSDEARLGVTVGGDTAGVDYNVTYAMYSGERSNAVGTSTPTSDIDANMMDITVGYSLPDVMNMRISAQMHADTGQDSSTDITNYTGFHYDQHNNGGLMDVVGYGNSEFTRVGVTLDPKEDLTVGVDYYMFTRAETTDDVYAPGNGVGGAATGYGLATGAGADDDVGTEIDLWVKKQYSSNFSTMLRYGQFAFGDAWGTSVDDASQIYLEGNMTF